MTKEERIAYVKKYGITPPECSCGLCSCLEDIDKGQQGGTCRLTHSFHKFTDICDCPKQRYWEVEIGPPPNIVDYKPSGCKYCAEYEDLPEHVIDGKPVGKIFDTCIQTDENGWWHIELPSGLDLGIRYCPYCGRELEEEI